MLKYHVMISKTLFVPDPEHTEIKCAISLIIVKAGITVGTI